MSRTTFLILLIAGGSMVATAQTGSDPLSYVLLNPQPINPAAGSTNPSAAATQLLNPYLGSVPGGKLVEGEIKLTLADAVRSRHYREACPQLVLRKNKPERTHRDYASTSDVVSKV